MADSRYNEFWLDHKDDLAARMRNPIGDNEKNALEKALQEYFIESGLPEALISAPIPPIQVMINPLSSSDGFNLNFYFDVNDGTRSVREKYNEILGTMIDTTPIGTFRLIEKGEKVPGNAYKTTFQANTKPDLIAGIKAMIGEEKAAQLSKALGEGQTPS